MNRISDSEYLKGVADISTRMGEMLGHLDDVTPDRMKRIVLDVQALAMEKAPVDTGTMIGTSYVDVQASDGTVTGEVHFPEKYAARQHEDVTLHHPNGGEAKYLEKAMIEKQDQIREQVAAMIAEAFGG